MAAKLESIVTRSNLAGNNKLEILLFSLGVDARTKRRETFGINVFKVREVMRTPPITAAPEMPDAVKGMVSLRGALVPVIDLAKHAKIQSGAPRNIMIVTEYNGRTQGFLVESVETILRLDWSRMRVPPPMILAEMGGLVTAVTELDDQRLAMMMDVEKVLSETSPSDDDAQYREIAPLSRKDCTVYFADDSLFARKQIERTLNAMGIKHIAAINGHQAWEALDKAAAYAVANGRPAHHLISLIITDIEMPEMDGYTLTRKIKGDARFAGIPIIMHSSLSGESNQKLGLSVGVDEYVSKYEPKKLCETLTRLLSAPPESVALLSSR